MESNNYNKKMAELKKTATERVFESVISNTINHLNALYPMAHAQQEKIMADAIKKREKVQQQWRDQKVVVAMARHTLEQEMYKLQDLEEQTKQALRTVDAWQHEEMCKCLAKIAPDTAKLSESFVESILQTMHEKKLLFEGDAVELASLRSEKYRQKEKEVMREIHQDYKTKVVTRRSRTKDKADGE